MYARRLRNLALATLAGAAGISVNETVLTTSPGSLMTQAEARIGRPLTPFSVAGVARRTTRRAVYGSYGYGYGYSSYGYGSPYYGSSYGYGSPYYGYSSYSYGSPYYGYTSYSSGSPY